MQAQHLLGSLNRLIVRGRVKCPVCRDEMAFERIKHDFRTAELTTSYKKETKTASKDRRIHDRKPSDLQDSSLKVVNGPACNVNTYVSVSRRKVLYADLMKVKCVQQKVYEYENDNNWILNICMINDQLWCCYADGEIRIFNKNCKLERQIMVDEVQNVCGLTEDANGDAILSCSTLNGTGLLQLNSQGGFLCTISEG